MKRLMISAFAAVALLAAATITLWPDSPSAGGGVGSAAMTSLQDSTPRPKSTSCRLRSLGISHESVRGPTDKSKVAAKQLA
jgi:hypothetical protein